MHAIHEAGCSGLHTAEYRAHWGAGDRCVEKQPSWSGKLHTCNLPESHESHESGGTSVWSHVTMHTFLAAASGYPLSLLL